MSQLVHYAAQVIGFLFVLMAVEMLAGGAWVILIAGLVVAGYGLLGEWGWVLDRTPTHLDLHLNELRSRIADAIRQDWYGAKPGFSSRTDAEHAERLVPRDIQRRVWKTARSMWADETPETRKAWLEARQDAINAVAATHLTPYGNQRYGKQARP